jgi:hypothetical protein
VALAAILEYSQRRNTGEERVLEKVERGKLNALKLERLFKALGSAMRINWRERRGFVCRGGNIAIVL